MKPTSISRRAFNAALLSSPLILRGAPGSQTTRVKIDTDRKIGEIDPKIYGNFAEHLGRCIEGGIFEEGSPRSDPQGYRKDVIEAVRNLHVGLLRWPGGNFSSNYHWMDGIGPRNDRPKRLEMAWHTIEDNRFGTHEFLDYVEMLAIEPYVCANFGTGTWLEAQQWVEYCNLDQDTAMTQLRKKNGRDEPWNVKYWSLGNEMDGPWQMGHRSADDYGKFALEGAKLMKWTDPTIKLVAAGSSNYNPNADWVGWNRTVLTYLKNHADYLSMHLYVGNLKDNFESFLASSLNLADKIETAEGTIRGVMTGEPKRTIYIAWDEWNVWYRARGQGKESGRRILEEHYNLEDALVIATLLNTFVNHCHIVKIANLAQLVNVIAPIFTNKQGLFLQTIYYPLQLFAMNSRGYGLELYVDGPSYSTAEYSKVPMLDVSAAYDNGQLVLNVVNRSRTDALSADFELEDKQFGSEFEVAEVNGPDIKAENDFGKTLVKAERKSASASGKRLQYTFPAHSYTMLKGRVS